MLKRRNGQLDKTFSLKTLLREDVARVCIFNARSGSTSLYSSEHCPLNMETLKTLPNSLKSDWYPDQNKNTSVGLRKRGIST